MSKKKFETVEEAENFIKEMQDAHKDEFAVFKQESEAAHKANVEDLVEQRTSELESKVEDLQNQYSDALSEVESLSGQLELKSKNTSGGEIVTVGNKSYAIKGKRFNVPGFGVLTADELATNKEALAHLVKVKSGVLVSVKGSK